MKAMRIHRLGDIDGLQLEELPDPQPGPGQVRVRVRAASLNYRDLLVVKGLYSRNLPLPLDRRCPTAPARSSRSAPA